MQRYIPLFCLLLTSCAQTKQAPVMTLVTREQLAWPSNVDDACAYLALICDTKVTEALYRTPETDLKRRQVPLLFYIRKRFGLDRGNVALLHATGQTDPEEAAYVILRSKWQRDRTAIDDPVNDGSNPPPQPSS